MFDTAVTLKYNQGHWKWCEWVKLDEFYHHAKIDINHIYSVQKNCNIKVFATYGQLDGQPNTDHSIAYIFYVSQQLFHNKADNFRNLSTV